MSDSGHTNVKGGALDAARRSHLASERTQLAWWRTGLSAFGLCIAIGGVLPAITNGADWLLVALGAAFGLLGVFLIGHGHLRRRSIDEAIERGDHLPVERGQQMALTLFGVSLGTALVVILVVLELRS